MWVCNIGCFSTVQSLLKHCLVTFAMFGVAGVAGGWKVNSQMSSDIQHFQSLKIYLRM
jgi:hypothetical protein